MSDRPLASRPAAPGSMLYADYAAGAPLRPEARAAIDAALASGALNASSTHWAGARARAILEDAREAIAAAIGAHPLEIVFTSGATEANNLALQGSAAILAADATFAVLATDHSSVLEPLRALAGRGHRVSTVPVDAEGCADRDALVALRPALLSFALVNAETGVIQEAEGLVESARRSGARLHVDAAQAPAVLRVDVDALGADLLTISGHKLGGPAGTGALYIRRDVKLRAIHHGGPQERGLRPGTENVPAIAGFAAACTVATRAMRGEAARLAGLCSRIEREAAALDAGLRVAGPPLASPRRAAHIVSLTFAGLRAESLVAALDLEGVAVSAGSACAAGAVEPSHVLLAMGRRRDEAESAMRVSLGWATTAADVDALLAALARVLGRARRCDAAEPAAMRLVSEVAP